MPATSTPSETRRHSPAPHTRADYFAAFSRLNSSNSIPNDEFHGVTSAANLGFAFTAATQARFTIRNTDSAQGVPGPYQFQGIAANQKQSDQNLYSGGTLENRTAADWHNLVRYGIARKREQFVTFGPVGTYVPAAFAYYGLSETHYRREPATRPPAAPSSTTPGTYPARYQPRL